MTPNAMHSLYCAIFNMHINWLDACVEYNNSNKLSYVPTIVVSLVENTRSLDEWFVYVNFSLAAATATACSFGFFYDL